MKPPERTWPRAKVAWQQPQRPSATPRQFKSPVAQSKSAAPANAARHPAAPPVYRPQAIANAVQQKAARPPAMNSQPTAPPVYRPQPVSRVLQAKPAQPQRGVVQPQEAAKRRDAPPAYRPQPTPRVLQTKKANGEQMSAGRMVCRPAAPTAHCLRHTPQAPQAMAASPQPRPLHSRPDTKQGAAPSAHPLRPGPGVLQARPALRQVGFFPPHRPQHPGQPAVANNGVIQREVHKGKRVDLDEKKAGLLDGIAEALDKMVGDAYKLVRDDPANPAYKMIDGYCRRWTTSYLQYVADKKVTKFLHARFGYIIESLASQEAKKSLKLPKGWDLELQGARGGTRPDMIVHDDHGQEVAWFDITASNSKGHIRKKNSTGWSKKPYVAEITYPSLKVEDFYKESPDEKKRAAAAALSDEMELWRKAKAKHYATVKAMLPEPMGTNDTAKRRNIELVLGGAFGKAGKKVTPTLAKGLLREVGCITTTYGYKGKHSRSPHTTLAREYLEVGTSLILGGDKSKYESYCTELSQRIAQQVGYIKSAARQTQPVETASAEVMDTGPELSEAKAPRTATLPPPTTAPVTTTTVPPVSLTFKPPVTTTTAKDTIDISVPHTPTASFSLLSTGHFSSLFTPPVSTAPSPPREVKVAPIPPPELKTAPSSLLDLKTDFRTSFGFIGSFPSSHADPDIPTGGAASAKGSVRRARSRATKFSPYRLKRGSDSDEDSL